MAPEIPEPGAVREQLPDGDLPGAVSVRVVGEHVAEGVVHVQLPRLDQLTDGDGGEHLSHRRRVVARVDRVADAVIEIRPAIAAREQTLSPRAMSTVPE